MEIDLTNLECRRIAEDAFRCVAEQSNTPSWFYPVVLACFVTALAVLFLVARMTLRLNKRRDRRKANKYVENDRRCRTVDD